MLATECRFLQKTAASRTPAVRSSPSHASQFAGPAIGMALKLARYVTGRHKTVSMWGAFHGANLDAISVGGEALFRKDVGPLLPGTEHVPPPGLARRFFGDDEVNPWRISKNPCKSFQHAISSAKNRRL